MNTFGGRRRFGNRIRLITYVAVGSLSLACLSLIGAGGGFTTLAATGSLRSTSMVTSFPFDEVDTGYLAASSNGFYRDAGVSMNLIDGTTATNAITLVADHKVDFGIIDASLLIQAESAAPSSGLVMLAVVVQSTPYGAEYIKGRGISSVRGLARASYADSGGSSATLYPTFLKYALAGTGLPTNAYKSITYSFSTYKTAFFAGDVQVITDVGYEVPITRSEAAAHHLSIAYLGYASHGFNPYSYGIVTTKSYLKSHRKVARGVVAASLRGVAWANTHRTKAAQLVAPYLTGVAGGIVRKDVNIAQTYIATKSTRHSGLGSMTKARWKTTYHLAVEGLAISNPVPLSGLYTTAYLPKHPVRP